MAQFGNAGQMPVVTGPVIAPGQAAPGGAQLVQAIEMAPMSKGQGVPPTQGQVAQGNVVFNTEKAL